MRKYLKLMVQLLLEILMALTPEESKQQNTNIMVK